MFKLKEIVAIKSDGSFCNFAARNVVPHDYRKPQQISEEFLSPEYIPDLIKLLTEFTVKPIVTGCALTKITI